MNKLQTIVEYLTYDDVLILPALADFNRSEISLETKLTKTLTLQSPFVSAPMDTVTESTLAIALAQLGGIGIIHRNLTIEQQTAEVTKVKAHQLVVGAAIGSSSGFETRAESLINAGVDIICVDSAHGHAKPILDTVAYLRSHYPSLQIMAGNVATYDGAQALIQAGVDSLRVGMGPGAICTTRIISGMGVPQLTAIAETARAGAPAGVPVIADGGIKYSGDMVKAFVAGASTVMMGRMFAQTQESPGEKVELTEHVPARFKDILTIDKKSYLFKSYRGMGSIAAMQQGSKIKSEDEFHGKNYQDRVMVAEGVEGLVPVTGTVKDVLDQAIGGIRSGCYYVGCKSIPELQTKAQFIKITQASLTESHPHSLIITNPGKNY